LNGKAKPFVFTAKGTKEISAKRGLQKFAKCNAHILLTFQNLNF